MNSPTDRVSGRRRVTVLSAGLGSPSSSRRLADRLAGAASRAMLEHGFEADITVVEVRDVAPDVTTALLTGTLSPELRQALQAVGDADALIAVTPVFTASYSGLFKSFVDLLEPGSLGGRPVLIGATGGSERHAQMLDHAMRPLFNALHALVLPTGVFAAPADWADPAAQLEARIRRAGVELAEQLIARPARQEPSGDPALEADIEELLRSLI